MVILKETVVYFLKRLQLKSILDTWEPIDNLEGVLAMVKEFEDKLKNNAKNKSIFILFFEN